jgi:hypothetical protein
MGFTRSQRSRKRHFLGGVFFAVKMASPSHGSVYGVSFCRASLESQRNQNIPLKDSYEIRT